MSLCVFTNRGEMKRWGKSSEIITEGSSEGVREKGRRLALTKCE